MLKACTINYIIISSFSAREATEKNQSVGRSALLRITTRKVALMSPEVFLRIMNSPSGPYIECPALINLIILK